MGPADTGNLLSALRALDVVLARLESLADLSGADVPPKIAADVAALRTRVERQSKKLGAGESHVAVIGLEKAGKSTLINAWLKADLLPNEQNRCTYATTELRSVERDADQAVHIEYLAANEYEVIERGYRERAQGPGRDAEEARKDLDEMTRYAPTIREHLGRSPEHILTPDTEGLCRLLWEKVANPKVARALRRVTLYSPKLYQRKGLVFHDVPGYDSPISMHKTLARDELARADVILFVQNASATTSLTGPQLEMLDVADAEDPDVQVHDKLFVFLNRIDQTTGDLEMRLAKSRDEWASKVNCSPERIVPGSAAAYLVSHASFLRPDTQGAIRYSREGVDRINAPYGDGVEHLQQVIEHYLDHERATVIGRRVAKMLDQGRRLAHTVLEALSPQYPESPDELELRQRVIELEAPARWFDKTWEDFQRRFGRFWSEKIEPVSTQDEMGGINPNLDRLRKAYLAASAGVARSFPSAESIAEEHARLRESFPTPVEVNIAVRKAMIERYIDPGLEDVTRAMTQTIVEVAREIADWVVRDGFYGVESVRAVVFPEKSVEAYEHTVDVAMRTLFLRYARPARVMFLRTARNTEDRRQMLSLLRAEVRALEEFYDNPQQPLRRNLLGYLEDGRWLDRAAMEQAAVAAIHVAAGTTVPPAVAAGMERGVDLIADKFRQASASVGKPITAVSEEIAADCQAFLDYLDHAIYRAAAFEDFAMQEFERLRAPLLATSARNAKNSIREQVFAAYIRKHPSLVRELGDSNADEVRLRQIVQAISSLRDALNEFERAGATMTA